MNNIDELSGILRLTPQEERLSASDDITITRLAEHVLQRRNLWPPGFVLEKCDLASGEGTVLRYKLAGVYESPVPRPPRYLEGTLQLNAAEKWLFQTSGPSTLVCVERILAGKTGRDGLWPNAYLLDSYTLESTPDSTSLRYKLRELGTTATESPPPAQEHPKAGSLNALRMLDVITQHGPAAVHLLMDYLQMLETTLNGSYARSAQRAKLRQALLELFP